MVAQLELASADLRPRQAEGASADAALPVWSAAATSHWAAKQRALPARP